MPRTQTILAVGENSFHVIGLDRRGAIVLRQKWRDQIWERFANMPAWRPASARTI